MINKSTETSHNSEKTYHNYVEYHGQIQDITSSNKQKKSGALDNLKNIEKYLSRLDKKGGENTASIFKKLEADATEIRDNFSKSATTYKKERNFVWNFFSKIHERRVEAVYNKIVNLAGKHHTEDQAPSKRHVDLGTIFKAFIAPESSTISITPNHSNEKEILARKYGFKGEETEVGVFIENLKKGVKELNKLGSFSDQLEEPTQNKFFETEYLPLHEQLENLSNHANFVTIRNIFDHMFHTSIDSSENVNLKKIKQDYPNIIFLLKALAFAGRNEEQISDKNKDPNTARLALEGLEFIYSFPKEARASAVELLLQRGLDPNVLIKSGQSLLSWARRIKDHDLVEVLFKYGADPEWMIKGKNPNDENIKGLFEKALIVFNGVNN